MAALHDTGRASAGIARRGQGKIAFAALRHPYYRPYFVGVMLAMMADNVEHVISYWVLWETFHSPALAGFAVISHWTPFLLFSVFFGSLADRFDCRRIIQAGQVIFMLASVAWGTLFLTGNLQVWHAVVLLILHGFAGSLWSPAGQLLIHDIVGQDHLQSAVRLSATGRQLGLVLGPAVGGILMLLLGPAVGLLVNTVLYTPLVVWLFTVPYTGHREASTAPARSRGLGLKDAFQILRQVSNNRVILAMVALVGLSALLVGNAFQAQMPGFAHALGTDQAGLAYSALLGANAVGAVLGGLLLEGGSLLQPGARTAVICAGLWALSMVGFALTRSYPVALALLLVAGTLNLAFSSMAQTLVQLLAPAELRGRVVGLFNMSQQGLRIGSGMTVGVLGSFIGIHWSLGLSAAVLLAVVVGIWGFVALTKEANASPKPEPATTP